MTDVWSSRADAYRSSPTHASDPDLDLVVEMCNPRAGKKILDVASGGGHVTRRLRESGAEVVSLDPSPGMHADVLAPAEHIPFADGSFDCVVAAWVLFHLPDIDKGLDELSRVLAPGGRLVATTNAERHMEELRAVAGKASWERTFTRENGSDFLEAHFPAVERRDADGWVTIEDDELVCGFVDSLDADGPLTIGPYELPLRCRRSSSVFVATARS